MAEEWAYVMLDDCFEFTDDELKKPDDFWVLCEKTITTLLEEGDLSAAADLYPEIDATMERGIFAELTDNHQFMDEFNKYFISKDHFDWIEEMTDQMADLTTGDELATSGLGLGVPTVLIEKLHDGRWGVKTLEDKAVIREHAGDWFVNQRVVLIAEYPHVKNLSRAEEDEICDTCGKHYDECETCECCPNDAKCKSLCDQIKKEEEGDCSICVAAKLQSYMKNRKN